MIPLPSWVDKDLWDEYVAQRKKDKKAMTPRSALGRLNRLFLLREAGYDANLCIEEALNYHWLDFYAPKEKAIDKVVKAESTQEYVERVQRERDAERARIAPPPANIREMVRKAVRVA